MKRKVMTRKPAYWIETAYRIRARRTKRTFPHLILSERSSLIIIVFSLCRVVLIIRALERAPKRRPIQTGKKPGPGL
jgi:hypothetical protein